MLNAHLHVHCGRRCQTRLRVRAARHERWRNAHHLREPPIPEPAAAWATAAADSKAVALALTRWEGAKHSVESPLSGLNVLLRAF